MVRHIASGGVEMLACRLGDLASCDSPIRVDGKPELSGSLFAQLPGDGGIGRHGWCARYWSRGLIGRYGPRLCAARYDRCNSDYFGYRQNEIS
jgi:hypothetical protein